MEGCIGPVRGETQEKKDSVLGGKLRPSLRDLCEFMQPGTRPEAQDCDTYSGISKQTQVVAVRESLPLIFREYLVLVEDFLSTRKTAFQVFASKLSLFFSLTPGKRGEIFGPNNTRASCEEKRKKRTCFLAKKGPLVTRGGKGGRKELDGKKKIQNILI